MYFNPIPYLYYPPSPWYYRTYPPVDVKIFSSSVKSSRLLLQQGTVLLNRLEDAGFAYKLMDAAQKGQKTEVDRLVHSTGIKIPVSTRFTPTGVIFDLTAPTSGQHPDNCCSLTLTMKWGF